MCTVRWMMRLSPEKGDEFAVFAQDGLGGQVVAAASSTAATSRNVVTFKGWRRWGDATGRWGRSASLEQHQRIWWRGSAGQWQVGWYLVSDKPHGFGREETDVESALTAPPHTLLWRWHVDHWDHIAHLKRKPKHALTQSRSVLFRHQNPTRQ